MLKYLRTWWQAQTGEDETPLDGDAPAWVVSLLVHTVVLVLVALVPMVANQATEEVAFTAPPPPVEEEEEVLEEEIKLPEEFYHSPTPSTTIGANSEGGTEVAFSEAPVVSDVSVIANDTNLPTADIGTFAVSEINSVSTGLHFNANYAVKGAAGVGTTGAEGAIDRITHEILLSLEERKTLVVWLFDQSASMIPQRKAVHDRFDRIYEELGVIEASGNDAFSKHADKPLLTTVIAFGKNITLRTPKPTDSLSDIKSSVAKIEMDNSGIENIFTAINQAVDQTKGFRKVDPETGEPVRNVMIIAFSDEIGDDMQVMDNTIQNCRKYAMPVYVVGVPAAFGVKTTQFKWVDPDPQYNQDPQWGEVDQGPESLMLERVRLKYTNRDEADTIDSGFGPFALTRLCYQTGGIYFAVHPNRVVGKSISRGDTASMSSHFGSFFDPEVMRKYRPDYVSIDEYKRRLSEVKSREALVKASMMSAMGQIESPRMRYVRRDEAALVNALSEAQMEAAKAEPKVNTIVETLRVGEVDRAKEDIPRWKAGYDLAMGQALAAKSRISSYNELLALAKRGYKFNGKNNTLVLEATNETAALTSALGKTVEKAQMYLQRVIDEHPGTPWAMLAQRELDVKMAWKWKEEFTDLAPPPAAVAGNNNAPAVGVDDMVKKLEKPVRALPKKL